MSVITVILIVTLVCVLFPLTASDHTPRPSWGCSDHSPTAQHPYKPEEDPLCFLSATSDNHVAEYLVSLRSIQTLYPCARKYLFNLDIESAAAMSILRSFRDLTILNDVGVMKLQRTGRYRFISRQHAIVYKAPMLLRFLGSFKALHKCSILFYGDASILLTKRLDDAILSELHAQGIVTSYPIPHSQRDCTHPDMYRYFRIQRNPLDLRHEFNQTPGGLMLIDVKNITLREKIIKPWAACVDDDNCVSPYGVDTKAPRGVKQFQGMQYK